MIKWRIKLSKLDLSLLTGRRLHVVLLLLPVVHVLSVRCRLLSLVTVHHRLLMPWCHISGELRRVTHHAVGGRLLLLLLLLGSTRSGAFLGLHVLHLHLLHVLLWDEERDLTVGRWVQLLELGNVSTVGKLPNILFNGKIGLHSSLLIFADQTLHLLKESQLDYGQSSTVCSKGPLTF